MAVILPFNAGMLLQVYAESGIYYNPPSIIPILI
jgi:hypothetical protein